MPRSTPSFRARRAHASAAVVAVWAALAGCSSVDDLAKPDGVDYRSKGAKSVALEVPPDLTQLARDPRYQAAGGSLSAAAIQAQPAPQLGSSAATAVVPANTPALRIERAGAQRWIATTQPPETLWPLLKEFIAENGLAIGLERADLGYLETDWSENRANLPQDIVRRTIGRVLSGLYDSGLRDQYRIRVERAAAGSEIYISHRGMAEIYADAAKERTRWQFRPSDPELEAVMLTRLMVKLGARPDAAKVAVAEAAAPPPRARAVPERSNALVLEDGFERAWRRVGIALDRTGFTVEDRDRAQGTFFVRYADPKLAGKEPPGFFARVFGGEKAVEATARYRIQLQGGGATTQLNVLDAQGQQPNAEAVQPIVKVLVDELR